MSFELERNSGLNLSCCTWSSQMLIHTYGFLQYTFMCLRLWRHCADIGSKRKALSMSEESLANTPGSVKQPNARSEVWFPQKMWPGRSFKGNFAGTFDRYILALGCKENILESWQVRSIWPSEVEVDQIDSLLPFCLPLKPRNCNSLFCIPVLLGPWLNSTFPVLQKGILAWSLLARFAHTNMMEYDVDNCTKPIRLWESMSALCCRRLPFPKTR